MRGHALKAKLPSRYAPAMYFAAAVAAYLALWWLVPQASFLPRAVKALSAAAGDSAAAGRVALSLAAMALLAVPTVLFMAIQVAIVYTFARLRITLWQALALLAGCLAGTIGLLALVIWQSGVTVKLQRYPNLQEHLWLLGNYFGPLRIFMTLLIVLAACTIGYLVSLRVRDRNLLLPVVMFAAYIDFWTVTRGPVSAVLKKAPHVAEAVSAPIPAAGAGAFVPTTFIGPGDFLFLALVFAVVHRTQLNARRNYWVIFCTMALGMVAVMLGLVGSLPALILLAVAVVAANWGRFRLTRQEALSTAVVAAVLVVSLPLVWSLVR